MKKKKQSKNVAYLKGKKLLPKNETLYFELFNLIDGTLSGSRLYKAIVLEEIPENMGKPFWEDLISKAFEHVTGKGSIYAILPRCGSILLPYQILKEDKDNTIYLIN